MQRLIPPLLWLACLLAMFALDRWVPGSWQATAAARLAGILPLAAGLWIAAASAARFRRAGTTIQTFGEPGRLVDDGWFARSRNPMYLGFALMLVGIALLLGSCTPFLMPVLFVVVTDRWYIRFEEAAMAHRFGEHYADYRRRVRRWI